MTDPTDPTVADPDLLTGRLFFAVSVPGASRAPLEAALPRLEPMLPGARLAPAVARGGAVPGFPGVRWPPRSRPLWGVQFPGAKRGRTFPRDPVSP